MIDLLLEFEHIAVWMMWLGVFLALSMLCAVVTGRVMYARSEERRHRFERQYGPLITRALAGNEDAARAHAVPFSAPLRARHPADYTAHRQSGPGAHRRHACAHARPAATAPRGSAPEEPLVVAPRARHCGRPASSRIRTAPARSSPRSTTSTRRCAAPPWMRWRTCRIQHRCPRSSCAFVTRRCSGAADAAALAAFGAQCEPLVLDLARADEGTASITPGSWPSVERCGRGPHSSAGRPTRARRCVRRLKALAHVGLDEPTAALAIDALESSDVPDARDGRAMRCTGGPAPAMRHRTLHHT